MSYQAKQVYTDHQVAQSYDATRFRSSWGRVVSHLEKKGMLSGTVWLLGDAKGQLVLDAPAGTGRLAASLPRPFLPIPLSRAFLGGSCVGEA